MIYLGSIFLFPLEIVFRSMFYARGSQAIGCHLRHRFELLNMKHAKLPTSSQFELSFIFTYVPLAVASLNVGLWDEAIRLLSMLTINTRGRSTGWSSPSHASRCLPHGCLDT